MYINGHDVDQVMAGFLGVETGPRAVVAGPGMQLPAGTAVNTPRGGGVLLDPLSVRSEGGPGRLMALGRARIQLVGHVNRGDIITIVPTG